MCFAGNGLTGTKLGCGEGGCGACTVMVSSWEGDHILHRSINACLCPVYAVEGMHVVTVEGVWRSPTLTLTCAPHGCEHPASHSLAGAAPEEMWRAGSCTPQAGL